MSVLGTELTSCKGAVCAVNQQPAMQPSFLCVSLCLNGCMSTTCHQCREGQKRAPDSPWNWKYRCCAQPPCWKPGREASEAQPVLSAESPLSSAPDLSVKSYVLAFNNIKLGNTITLPKIIFLFLANRMIQVF